MYQAHSLQSVATPNEEMCFKKGKGKPSEELAFFHSRLLSVPFGLINAIY